jgi:hypothetical protein
MTTTVVNAAAAVPAIVGVNSGVGRAFGPSAAIEANSAATMKIPSPTLASMAELTASAANITTKAMQMTTTMANARETIKARIDLSRTRYNQTKVPLLCPVHIMAGVLVAMLAALFFAIAPKAAFVPA